MAEFHWRFNDSSGTEVGSSEPFATKEQAEQWMGERWADLLAEGSETVTLMSNGEILYEMGLRAG